MQYKKIAQHNIELNEPQIMHLLKQLNNLRFGGIWKTLATGCFVEGGSCYADNPYFEYFKSSYL
jgi:hypothetical protein